LRKIAYCEALFFEGIACAVNNYVFKTSKIAKTTKKVSFNLCYCSKGGPTLISFPSFENTDALLNLIQPYIKEEFRKRNFPDNKK
jgi:hypothetical protein